MVVISGVRDMEEWDDEDEDYQTSKPTHSPSSIKNRGVSTPTNLERTQVVKNKRRTNSVGRAGDEKEKD